MKAIEVIKSALKSRGMLQKDLAAAMGLSPQGFSKKLVNNTISAQEFFDAIDQLNMTVSISDKDTGKALHARLFKPGILPRVSMMVGGIRYDTANSDALCHTEERDGLTMELYRDYRGGYFVVI
jgi:transcriptional regulator with XRE-family HTH domain